MELCSGVARERDEKVGDWEPARPDSERGAADPRRPGPQRSCLGARIGVVDAPADGTSGLACIDHAECVVHGVIGSQAVAGSRADIGRDGDAGAGRDGGARRVARVAASGQAGNGRSGSGYDCRSCGQAVSGRAYDAVGGRRAVIIEGSGCARAGHDEAARRIARVVASSKAGSGRSGGGYDYCPGGQAVAGSACDTVGGSRTVIVYDGGNARNVTRYQEGDDDAGVDHEAIPSIRAGGEAVTNQHVSRSRSTPSDRQAAAGGGAVGAAGCRAVVNDQELARRTGGGRQEAAICAIKVAFSPVCPGDRG